MKKTKRAPKEILEIDDFGVTITKNGVQLKVWAPCAIRVRVAIYDEGDDLFRREIPMESVGKGIFILILSKDFINKYYTYIITSAETDYEVVDPFAVAAGPNSEKAMIVDMSETNPDGWIGHTKPDPVNANEAILYELHIRDFSIDENSGMVSKGKYLAFTEEETTFENVSTGINHLKELGITHVHLLPVFDFKTVDEMRNDEYNWGYDPGLFNTPEGSYATDALDGRVRIRELKKCIMALHEAGIRVVLDVVYNHTYDSIHSNFNRLAPGFYYRTDEDGNFTNGSGCGNEMATENPLVRKFIIHSLKFWLDEYKVDGFRFDLLALYDQKTVKNIVKELKKIRPDVILYGEPWTGWESVLPHEKRFLKSTQRGLDIGLFNDDFRNALKGDNDGTGKGFVSEQVDMKPWVELGIVASTKLPVDRLGYADRALEVVNYVSAHDNLVLWDKIDKSAGQYDFLMKVRMHRLALTIVLTSFGTAFIQSGTEFMRTKQGHDNSYNAGDEINKLDWALKIKNITHFEFIRDLIEYRKNSGFFGWNSADDIEKHVDILNAQEGIILYRIRKSDGMDCIVIHNGTGTRKVVQAPEGIFKVILNHESVHLNSDHHFSTRGERPVHVEPFSSIILEGYID